ncbi:MAG: lysophospholipid acyltransferase family protein [Marinicellaceae bacterium]
MKPLLFNIFLFFGRKLSLKKGRSFSEFLGKLVWKFSKKNKHITLSNISKCYPHLNQTEQIRLAKASVNAALMNMMELGVLWDKKTKIHNYIDKIHGMEIFSSALDQGNGLILAAPHMGNWEVLNLLLAEFDQFAFLYKPPSDAKIEKLLVKNRAKSNALQIEANLKGVRKIMHHLKDKGFIAILPDQRPKGGQGVFAPFYGIPTYTMSLFSKLSIKTKAPVFFAYALRTEKGFEVFFEKSDDDIYQELNSSVAYMNKKIQHIVDKAPEQYQWTYKRFSIQPEGEPPFY